MNDAEVIKKYSALVNYIAQSRTRQPSDAEDVFQEVFLKYVDKQPKFKNEEHAKAWFIRVTVNTAASLYRKHSFQKREDFNEEVVEQKQIKDSSAKDEWTTQIEEDAAFEENINKLHPRYRAVMMMRFKHNFTPKEIAQVLGESENAVTSLLYRGKKQYRDWLNDFFNVGMKKTENGCTLEIIEARVDNDFLYVNVKANDTYKIHFDGRIYDGKGNEFNLVSGYYVVGTEPTYYQIHELLQIYVPGLKEHMQQGERYSCDLNVKAYPLNENAEDLDLYGYYEYYYQTHKAFDDFKLEKAVPLADMSFQFEIGNQDAINYSYEYDVNYEISNGELCYHFRKCLLSDSEASFLIEVTPVKPDSGKDLSEYTPYLQNAFVSG